MMKSILDKKKTILAGIFGNALECYDFSVYVFLSPVLAIIFFPNKNPLVSLLFTFGVFALSFFVRPLGGILFGYLGDHFGRKRALIISITAMSISTFFLGLLPSYAAIGIWAPIFLTLFRLVQGVAVSGEMTTAMSYLIEHAHNQYRGFIGSLALCSASAGTVISSGLVALITTVVKYEQLLSWAWRLPFLFGGLIGVIGLLIRLRSEETLLYQTARKISEKKSKSSIFSHYSQLQYRPILVAVLLTSIMAISYYFLIAYFNAFLINTMRQPTQTIILISFISQLLLTFLLPIPGIISDKVGRKPVLITGMIALILLVHPIFWLLQQREISLILLGELLFVIIFSPVIATLPTILAEMFDVHIRNSGISLGYNIGQAIFGGTAPLIAFNLTAITANLYAPAWYLFASACISLLAALKIKESYKQPLT